MLTYVMKTILDDSISGDKIHGGFISGLTGLEVLAGGPGVDINAGAIDGTTIGATVASTGRFTNLQILQSVSWLDQNITESVNIQSISNYGLMSIKYAGVTQVRLSGSNALPNYFLTKVIIGSTIPSPGYPQSAAAILSVVGNVFVLGNFECTNLQVRTNANFASELYFDASGGMRSLRDLYVSHTSVRSWYDSFSSAQRADLVGISHSIYTQLKNVGANSIGSTAWLNLSNSNTNEINASAWLNLYNSRAEAISEAIWGFVGDIDQDVSSTASPKFALSTTDDESLVYQKTIQGNLETVSVQTVDMTFTVIGSSDGARTCICKMRDTSGAPSDLISSGPYLEISPAGGNWPDGVLPEGRDVVCPIVFDVTVSGSIRQLCGYILIPKSSSPTATFTICKYDRSDIIGPTGISPLMDSTFSYQL